MNADSLSIAKVFSSGGDIHYVLPYFQREYTWEREQWTILPGQGPVRVGIPVADLTAGLFAAMGVMVAIVGTCHNRRSIVMERSSTFVSRPRSAISPAGIRGASRPGASNL